MLPYEVPDMRVIPYPAIPLSLATEARRYFGKTETSPFIPHEQLVERATHAPPSEIAPTVSAFVGWIYDLYVHEKDERSLEASFAIEARFKRLFQARKDPAYPRRVGRDCRKQFTELSNWAIEYED